MVKSLRRTIRIMRYLHLFLFMLIIGASFTLDFSGCIFWLPEFISKILTVILFACGFFVGIVLLINENNKIIKLCVSITLLFYLIMLTPLLLPF